MTKCAKKFGEVPFCKLIFPLPGISYANMYNDTSRIPVTIFGISFVMFSALALFMERVRLAFESSLLTAWFPTI